MAKITINCGQCSTKNCNIKKEFRELVVKYTKVKCGWSSSMLDQTFNLKCPYKTHKYQKGDKVLITVGVRRYKEEFKHECLMENDGYGDPCNGCKFKDKCDGGEVTHINTKYKEYVKIYAVIDGYFKSDKYVYQFDIKQLDGKINDLDKEFFKSMNETFGMSDNEFYKSESHSNVSKSKFIELIIK